jgi:hypothetical protein
VPDPLIRRRWTEGDLVAFERIDCVASSSLSRTRMASMISSNNTTRPAGVFRNAGAASIAQASDAHDARMALFVEQKIGVAHNISGTLKDLGGTEQPVEISGKIMVTHFH